MLLKSGLIVALANVTGLDALPLSFIPVVQVLLFMALAPFLMVIAGGRRGTLWFQGWIPTIRSDRFTKGEGLLAMGWAADFCMITPFPQAI